MLPHSLDYFFLGLCSGHEISANLSRMRSSCPDCLAVSCCLLEDVAVARAARCRDGDCRNAFNVAVMGNGEAAVDSSGDCHDLQEIDQLLKCEVLHLFVPFSRLV